MGKPWFLEYTETFFMKKILIRPIFSLLLFVVVTAPLKSQPIDIEGAALVRSMCNALFLIVKVIENQVSTFYHIYQLHPLQENSGQFWGSYLEQLDSVNINQQSLIVTTTSSFKEVSYIPTEFAFIRWVFPSECDFR